MSAVKSQREITKSVFLGSLGNAREHTREFNTLTPTIGDKKDRSNTSRAIFGDDEHATWREVYRLMRCVIPNFKGDEIYGTKRASRTGN